MFLNYLDFDLFIILYCIPESTRKTATDTHNKATNPLDSISVMTKLTDNSIYIQKK